MTKTVSAARYFMLHGWARFLASSDNADTLRQIEKRRHGGNWGIANADDYWALQWQRYDFRRSRAQRAIGNDKIRSYRFTGEGPVTIPLGGVAIPGWETDPEEQAKKADTDRMQKRRLHAQRACRLLRDMPEPYNVHEELARLDNDEAIAEAMGYYR